MMNPAITHPFVGLDIHGRPVSGIIRHVSAYAKGSTPLMYTVQLYRDDGKLAGCAFVDAKTINRHVAGMELVEIINQEAE